MERSLRVRVPPRAPFLTRGSGAGGETRLIGGILKRSTRADCKSAGFRLPRFESLPHHHQEKTRFQAAPFCFPSVCSPWHVREWHSRSLQPVRPRGFLIPFEGEIARFLVPRPGAREREQASLAVVGARALPPHERLGGGVSHVAFPAREEVLRLAQRGAGPVRRRAEQHVSDITQ